MFDPGQSVLDRIVERWHHAPDLPLITLLTATGPRPLKGTDLLKLARRWAGGLAAAGVRPGDRVAMALGTSEDLLGALFGSWWLGAAVVPLAPINPRQSPASEAERLTRALVAADARLAIFPAKTQALFETAPVPMLAPKALAPGVGPETPAATRDLAVLQFSSGSTGHPKGVALGDRQLAANLSAIQEVVGATSADRGVSWLPLHHDMGLVGTLLYPLSAGFDLYLMAPEHFIMMPWLWLQAMTHVKATLTAAPNFAYQLLTKLSPGRLEGTDLSSLRVAMVGAEPVHPLTLETFTERFAPMGFRREAWIPTYGLAEATLAVTMTRPEEGPTYDRVVTATYQDEHRAVVPESDDQPSRLLTSVGEPLPGYELSLRSEAGHEVPERQVGEIWIKAPSLMTGYYGAPELSAQVLQGGYLRTGDLGYLAGGKLYVSGRLKDLIIKGGCKYHPQDLEGVAEANSEVRAGGSAAFTVGESDERLVMVVETKLQEGLAEVSQRIRSQIMEAVGVRVDEVRMVGTNQLPKTTSGKIRRQEAKRLFLAGAFEPLHA